MATKPIDPAALEQAYGVKLPARYRTFLAKEYRTYNGRFATRLPNSTGSTKLRVRFDDPSLVAIDEDWQPKKHRGMVPLARIGGDPEFFVVDTTRPACPVRLWEHETGKLVPIANSLDQFLASLIAKGQPTPYQRIKTAVAAATKLRKAGQHGKARTVLDAALAAGDPDGARGEDEQQAFADAFTLRGRCQVELGAFAKAIADFERAIEMTPAMGTSEAVRLLIVETLGYRLESFAKATAAAKKLKADSFGDTRMIFGCNAVLGYVALRTKKPAQADQAYREIDAAFYRKTNPEIRATRDQLAALAEAGNRHAATIATWFGKAATPTGSADDRAWWASLDASGKSWRPSLIEAMELRGEPDDADLAQLGKVNRVRMLDGNVRDLAPLRRLTGVQDLSSQGAKGLSIEALRDTPWLTELSLEYAELADLTPLAALTKLTFLFLGNNRITSIAPLAGLHDLDRVQLGDNRIEDLAPMAGWTKLDCVWFDDNAVRSIAALRGLTELTQLGFRDNQVTDLEPLVGLRKLAELELSGNPIRDLSPLARLPALAKLDCGNIAATDLSVLAGCKALRELDWRSNKPLVGVASLAGLRSLKSLRLDRDSVDDKELAAFKKLRRDVDVRT